MFDVALQWLANEGGPFLLLPAEVAHVWEGNRIPSGGRVVKAQFRSTADPSSPATDYDRACDLGDGVRNIEVGGATGIVIGGETPLVAWVDGKDGGGSCIVVALEWDDLTDEDAIRAAGDAKRLPMTETDVAITVGTSGLTFFSAYDTIDSPIDVVAHIALRPGRYKIGVAEHCTAAFNLYRVLAFTPATQ